MKNLTLRYGFTQFTHWASTSGAAIFATTYLLGKGLPAGVVGTLLAAAGLLSCGTQPFLAAADRAKKWILPVMMIGLSLVSMACLAVQLIPQLPLAVVGICYMAAIWSADALAPLLNALSVAYNQEGFRINYGVGRSVGSAATALSSLVLGSVLAQFGATWMIGFLLIFKLLNIIVIAGYPSISHAVTAEAKENESCTVWQFFFRYRWYCAFLTGVLFLGMYLAMTENYMIVIMEHLGGDSRHVGTALFISAKAAAPVIFFLAPIRKRFRDECLLKIAAAAFLLRAVLMYAAPNIVSIYLVQILQVVSYPLLVPVQVFYAEAKVRKEDMVKGQAFGTAAYALGCSAGNFLGGQLVGAGPEAILLAGIGMALAGTIILLPTVGKSDIPD